MFKRVIYFFIALFLLSPVSLLFANGQTETSGGTGPVTITFWHNYSAGAESDYLVNTVIPMFEKEYPGIKVDIVAQGSDQYNNLLITAMGTGTAPDVARIDLGDLANYAKLGGVIPLDKMSGFKQLSKTVLPGPLSTNLYKSVYYGLPLDTNCKTAVVNMNKMKEIGFTSPPKTMEEFITASKEKSPGKPTISVSSLGEWDILPYFWLFGGKMSDSNYKKTSGFFDSADSVNAVKTILELYKEKVLAIKELDGTPDAWDGIQKGNYAMFFEGPWFFNFISDYKDKNIVPATIPTYHGKTTSIVGGESICIFSGTKHPQEAYSLVKFILSENVQTLLGQNIKQIPVLTSLTTSPVFAENDVWKVYMEQLKTAKARIPSPQGQLTQEHIKDAFMQIFTEGKDIKATLTATAKLIDEELAN